MVNFSHFNETNYYENCHVPMLQNGIQWEFCDASIDSVDIGYGAFQILM